MVRRQRASSATLFLMELIVSVMYFSLAATLCIAIFVRAHVMSQEARDLNAGVNMASDAAAVIRSSHSLNEANKLFVNMYPDALITNADGGSIIMIYFDESKEPCGTDKAYYHVEVNMSDNSGLISANIIVTDPKDNDIYKLPVTHTVYF